MTTQQPSSLDVLSALRSHAATLPPGSGARATVEQAIAEMEALSAANPATFQGMVAAFHLALGVPARERPTVPPADEVRLRLRLITEEFFEVLGASNLAPDVDGYGEVRFAVLEAIARVDPEMDLTATAHELADLAYVIFGTCVQLGIDLVPVFRAVHAANMAKLGGERRPDGTILKPAGWRPADVAAVLREQGAELGPTEAR